MAIPLRNLIVYSRSAADHWKRRGAKVFLNPDGSWQVVYIR